MVIEIPNKLKKREFRFILLAKNSKLPIEDDWQNTNNYTFDDPKLLKHLEVEGNYGVLGGPGELRILDIDDIATSKKLLETLETYTQKTCGGTNHFFILSNYNINHKFEEGEFRATNQYVVGPNCYAIDKNKNHEGKYEIVKDLNILYLDENEVAKLLSNFIKILDSHKENILDKNYIDKKVIPFLDDNTRNLILYPKTKEELNAMGYPSRSERDEKIIVELLQRGFGEYIKSIFELYPAGDKYREHNSKEKYLLHQISAAREFTGIKEDLFLKLLTEMKFSTEQYLTNKILFYLKNISEITENIKQKKLVSFLAFKTKISKKDLDKQLTIIKNSKESKNPISLLDLLQMESQEVEYFIEPLIPKHTVIMIAGKAGKFKTMLVLSLALAAINQSPYLETFRTTNSPIPKILYYDLENGPIITKQRIEYLIKGLNLDIKKLSSFHLEFNFNKNNIKQELSLAESYDIVILDSYRRFLEGTENDSEITDKFYIEYLKKLKEMGKTVIILHHLKKELEDDFKDEDLIDLFRGSTDIPAQLDLAFKINMSEEIFDTNTQSNYFTVSVSKAKNRLGLPLRNFSFHVIKNDVDKKTSLIFNDFKTLKNNTKPKDKLKDLILKILKDGELSRQELITSLKKESNYSTASIDRILAEMMKDMQISQTEYGKYII